jgi:uncharacterized protein YdeI (YjbR/CyaY-like superfamily)
MGKKDPRIDAYIDRSADFAKPILTHFRKLVHRACPETEETLKWSFPHFLYKGMLCGIASFKNHCAINFWKQSLIFDEQKQRDAMGQFGRITSLSDLPSDKKMIEYIKKAARLNETGVKVVRRPRKRQPQELELPDYFVESLKKNSAARIAFEHFSPSQKREYVEWITEAKTDATRERRLTTAIEWMEQGKTRYWKYLR